MKNLGIKYSIRLNADSDLFQFADEVGRQDNPDMHADALTIYKTFSIEPAPKKIVMFSDDDEEFNKLLKVLGLGDGFLDSDKLQAFPKVADTNIGTSYRVAPDVIVTDDDGAEYTPPAIFILV